MVDTELVSVFTDGPGGGNPAVIVLDGAQLTDEDRQSVARGYGHESSFVVDAVGTGCELALRFWVPNHEMEMCGHATLGTVWLLARLGRLKVEGVGTDGVGQVRVHTVSGVVLAQIAGDGSVRISQPVGRVEAVQHDHLQDEVLDALGLTADELADRPIQNAATSRTKTLVPLTDVARLDAITPDYARVEAVCGRLGSTGLYPYAISGTRQVDARQFPRSSGYPEDPATGIAAAALAFGLLADRTVQADEQPLVVRQGRAMGRPSTITVQFRMADGEVTGCWLGGRVERLLA